MKNIIKKGIGSLIVLLLITACGDLYETHEKYLKMDEKTYIGRADSLQVKGGYQRVELNWKINSDPRISKCIITWDDCKTPIEVPIDHSTQKIAKVIEIPEGKYTFKIIVKSDTGKESLTSTVSGESFGVRYQSRLPNKSIKSMYATPEGIFIEWTPEENCVGVNLSYIDKDGNKKELFIKNDESKTIINDAKLDTEFTTISLFKPEVNAIDIIKSLPKTLKFPSFYTISKEDWDLNYLKLYENINKTNFTIEASTEETEDGSAQLILDGKVETFWHSRWRSDIKSLPHTLIIDMQNSQDINSIELIRRINNKDTKDVYLSVSENKEDWTEIGQINYPSSTAINSIILLLEKPIKGRYLKLEITSSNNGSSASLGEIHLTSRTKNS